MIDKTHERRACWCATMLPVAAAMLHTHRVDGG